jgi:hypothetical protein
MPPPARERASKRQAPTGRKPSRAHLLIIECDSQGLASGGMHLASAFEPEIRRLFPNKRIVLVRTFTERQLRADLADVIEKYGRFRAVLMIGHSNPSELMLTGEGCCPWATVGRWIEKFEPELLFLVACEAGQSTAVRDLFGSVESLRQIYASPVALYREHAASLAVLVFMLLVKGKINPRLSKALRFAHYVQSGGQVYRWKRDETGPGQERTAMIWDAASKALDFGRWDLLQKLLP